MIGQAVSHYRILSKLGEGAMSVVYAAEDTLLGRRVAFKVLSEKTEGQRFRARMLREARVISSVNHHHIATIHEYGETKEGHPYIVMELVNGPTLRNLIRDGSLSLARAVELIEGVAEGLAEAHRHGIIHRDIKPSNVAINDRGEVKILDFGIAKHLNGSGGLSEGNPNTQDTQTVDGAWVGTPMYSSPEQALGMKVDTRSDLFSLGALLYECIAGQPAFDGENVSAVRFKVIRDDPPPPSQFNPAVSPTLDGITLKALAKKAEERYQTAEEVLAELRIARQQLSASPAAQPFPAITSPVQPDPATFTSLIDTLRRPRLLWAVFLAAVIFPLLLTWVISQFRRERLHRPPPEAVRLYNEGTDDLFNGAYYKASQALERAVNLDNKFALAQVRFAEALSELDYDDKAKEAMLRADALLMTDMSALSSSDTSYVQAIHGVITGDFEGAANKYAAIAASVSDRDKTLAYMGAARAREKSGLTDTAIEDYETVTRQNPQYAAAFLRLGILHGRKLSQAESFKALETAEALYRKQNNPEGVAETLYQSGYLLNNLNKPVAARMKLQSALEMARTEDDKPQSIKTLVQLGISFYLDGKADIAEQYITSAVESAQAQGNETLLTNALIDWGNVFFVRGKYDEAEKYFKQAYELAVREKGRRGEARAALSLGSLRMQEGKTDAAIEYVKQALAFYRQGQYYKETSSALLLLGRAQDYRGEYEAALQSLDQQLQLAQSVGDRAQLAHSHVEIGSSLQHQERYTEALDHFNTSLSIDRSLSLTQNAGYDQMNRGNLLWQLGSYNDARAALDEAASIARQSGGGSKQLLAWVELFLARMELSEQNFAAAKEKSEAAYQLSRQQFKDIAAQAMSVSGLASAFSGMPRAGVLKCEEAVAIARLTGDPRLIAYSHLALAEALLEGGETERAVPIVAAAQESFARSGQLDSQWRALLIAALASQRRGDGDSSNRYASNSAAALSQLQQRWGAEVFDKYLARPDIRNYSERLNNILAGKS
jgi:serine/threonine-protein kinase